jgi:hypothetical protein
VAPRRRAGGRARPARRSRRLPAGSEPRSHAPRRALGNQGAARRAELAALCRGLEARFCPSRPNLLCRCARWRQAGKWSRTMAMWA